MWDASQENTALKTGRSRASLRQVGWLVFLHSSLHSGPSGSDEGFLEAGPGWQCCA